MESPDLQAKYQKLAAEYSKVSLDFVIFKVIFRLSFRNRVMVFYMMIWIYYFIYCKLVYLHFIHVFFIVTC